MRTLSSLAVFLLFFMALTGSAQAAQSTWQEADYLRARLVASPALSVPADIGEGFMAGLQVELQPGWHAYWRMPGDAGLPVTLDPAGSENIKTALGPFDILWPAPKRFVTDGFNSFGYEEAFTLALPITPEDKSAASVLNVAASIMVCSDICVPQNISLRLAVPAGERDAESEKIINDALDLLPKPQDKEKNPGLVIENVILGPEALVVSTYAQKGYENADVFIEIDGDDGFIMTAKPSVTPRGDDAREALLRIAAPERTENLMKALNGKSVLVTFTDGTDAVMQRVQF